MFAFQNFETNEKINEILKYQKEKEIEKEQEEEQSESQINLSNLEESNNDFSENNKSKEVKIINIQNGHAKIEIKKDPHKMFNKLINIIINDYLNYPNYSHFLTIKNIYLALISPNKPKGKEKEKNHFIRIIFHCNDFHINYAIKSSETVGILKKLLILKFCLLIIELNHYKWI